MKTCVVIALFAFCATAESSDAPIQKVIQLMQNMVAKSKTEKQDEQVAYSAYQQFCTDTSESKTKAIGAAAARMEQLETDIAKCASDIHSDAKAIAGLNADVSKWDSDAAAAKAQRKAENAEYEALNKDLSESVDALERAINTLKKQNYDRKQAEESLLQVKKSAVVPSSAKRVIASFLATSSKKQDPDTAFLAAPEANAYEFQSSSVIDMLKGLLEKFDNERNTAQREEANALHAFNMVTQDLTDQIAAAKEEIGEKTTEKAASEKDKANAEGDLADTTSVHGEDTHYLGDLKALCQQKADDFASRQALRADEIEALNKAIEIMSSDGVSGSGSKHLNLAQKAVSFVQLRATSNGVQQKAANYLQKEASQLHSDTLSMLAMKVAADPFKSVKKMIKDMVTRLMEEAHAEAEHKGWCDTEMGTNKQTRDEKTAQIEKLDAEIEELTATSAKLSEDIAALSQAISDSDQAVATATADREAEKAKNEATIKDSQEAQVAVANALAVLKEFYAKAGGATAFVQAAPADDAPETFSSPYKGNQGAAGGVVGMLEVIQSDFARLETETAAAESQSAKEHKAFLNDSETDKAVKTTDVEHKTNKKAQTESALAAAKKDRAGTEDELIAANRYYDNLKPTCVDQGTSYEDRVAKREAEIESLREALKILSGETI